MTPSPYREAFESADVSRLLSLCADDVTLHSPLVSAPGAEGRDAAALLMPIVFGGMKDIEVVHDLGDDRSHVVVADTRVRDERIKFSMFLELDAAGKISDLWFMVRPLKGITTILEAVGRFLDGGARDGGSVVYDLAKPLAALASATDRAVARMVDELNRGTRPVAADTSRTA